MSSIPPTTRDGLGEEDASQEELKAMLRPAPAEVMESFPVGAAVGSVKNNSASLIEPLEACLAGVDRR
jgi:putative SOS response-associated peptidase YedK